VHCRALRRRLLECAQPSAVRVCAMLRAILLSAARTISWATTQCRFVALSASLFGVRYPLPRCAFAYKSDGDSSFRRRKEKTRRVSRAMILFMIARLTCHLLSWPRNLWHFCYSRWLFSKGGDAPYCGQAPRACANLSNMARPHLNIYPTKFSRDAEFSCDSWARGWATRCRRGLF